MIGNQEYTIAKDVYQRLRKTYWIAISLIAISILFNFFLVRNAIQQQQDDATIINRAGRQRMLSQKLVKEILLIGDGSPMATALSSTMEDWKDSHFYLKQWADQNSKEPILADLFAQIQAPLTFLQNASNKVLDSGIGSIDRKELLSQQEAYLLIMEEVVQQFETEALAKIERLKKTELIITFIAFLVLFGELLFLFWPTASYIRRLIVGIKSSEEQYKFKSEENEELKAQAEINLNELQAMYGAVDQASLFAGLDLDGRIVYISQKFRDFLGEEPPRQLTPFEEYLTSNEAEQSAIHQMLTTPRSKLWTGEASITTSAGQQKWLEFTVVNQNKSGVKHNILILCSDLTAKKDAQKRIDELSSYKFQLEMEAQKLRAVQVVEAQESQRKRIAKDMHDGIGQMLTALKFNMESINLDNPVKAGKKLALVKGQLAEIIQGVRMVTFSLTPPELSDYGLAVGLDKLAEGLSTLTNKEIIFVNKSGFDLRFDFKTEINLFRITQEAVNNAVKYAESDSIIITLNHDSNMLSISVEDEGKGFDVSNSKARASKNGSGMGLSFMKERVSHINGRLFIQSNPGAGTKVTINMPLAVMDDAVVSMSDSH